jgi:hypothetical protein
VTNNPPRKVDIKGQPHMLAYITPEEGGILQLLGGSGKPGPMGIPSFFVDDFGDFSSVDASDTSSPSVDDGSSYSDDSASDTSATYSVDDSGQETDSFSLAEPSVYGTDAGLSDAAITSIGVPAGSGTDSQFFGGPDYNIMDFGRGSVSNIRDTSSYDPNFAALNMISRGLTPSFDLRNRIDFDVPTSMLPQLEGIRGPLGPKYYSPFERTLQETIPAIMRDIPTPMNLLGKALDSITGAVDKGKSFFADATGGFKSTGDFFSGIFDSTPGRDFMQNDDSGDNVGFDSRGQNVLRDDRPGRISDPIPDSAKEALEEEKRRQQELERQRRLNQLYDMSRDAMMFQVASDFPRLQVGPFSTNLASSRGILDNFGVNLANVEENIRNINRLNI